MRYNCKRFREKGFELYNSKKIFAKMFFCSSSVAVAFDVGSFRPM